MQERWFIHAGDPARALTLASETAHDGGLQALTTEVDGLVMLTQTCDIVRDCVARPFVEVCPLVAIDDDQFPSIEKGQRPNFVFVPSLAAQRLVGDLDRVMTVEKSVVAGWKRTDGCTSDEDSRAFAQSLARKRARTAFPDDFTAFVDGLRRRMVSKHGKESPEGRALAALREIRVSALPDWGRDEVQLMFWFIPDENHADFEGRSWDKLLESWLALVPAKGRFSPPFGQVVGLRDLTADDYVNSDPLDLGYLSFGS